MNIYEKLSAITEEISAVAKNLEVGYGKSKYKAVGEADVLAAVKPIERKHGVYSYPVSREIVDSGVMENVDRDGNVKRQLYLRIKTTYRFVNLDDPADFVLMEVYSDGVDTQDKAPGKAMTYGDKYALLKAYKIITGDDPDQKASDQLSSVMSDKDRAKMSYPDRDVMVKAIKLVSNKEALKKWLDNQKITEVDEASDAAVMALYRYYEERGAV